MLKISDATKKIIVQNPAYLNGLSNKLFNLTKLASFLKPMIESQTKKEVKETALVMSLSRLQKELEGGKEFKERKAFVIEGLTLKAGLEIMTFDKNSLTKAIIEKIYQRASKNKAYVALSEGMDEITLITEKNLLPKQLPKEVKYKFQGSAVIIKFNKKYLQTPGLIFQIIQYISLQNINILEITSTATEIIFYIEDKNAGIVFDTLNNKFLTKRRVL